MKDCYKSLLSELPLILVAVFYVGFLLSFDFQIVLCPFTKVEESFNVQAWHDLLYYGLDVSKYDHIDFPGVVPRTFIGSIIISYEFGLMHDPLVGLVFRSSEFFNFWMNPNSFLWFVVFVFVFEVIGIRTVLAILNCIGIHRLRKALVGKYGTTAGYCFILICCTQFHLMFYLGRPLPNTFAMAIVSYAFGCFLDAVFVISLVCSLGVLQIHLFIDLLLCGDSMWYTCTICSIPSISSLHKPCSLSSNGCSWCSCWSFIVVVKCIWECILWFIVHCGQLFLAQTPCPRTCSSIL